MIKDCTLVVHSLKETHFLKPERFCYDCEEPSGKLDFYISIIKENCSFCRNNSQNLRYGFKEVGKK